MSSKNQDLLKLARNRFNIIYSGIFGEISSMLKLAKLCPIHVLQSQNPSFTYLLNELKSYEKIVIELNGIFKFAEQEDVTRISEYILVAEKLANAIDNYNIEELTQAISELDEKPYI